MQEQEYSEYEWNPDAETCTESKYARTDIVDPEVVSLVI